MTKLILNQNQTERLNVLKPRIRRVQLPPKQAIVTPDTQMLDTAEKLQNDKMVPWYCEANPQTDYLVALPDGSYDVVCLAPEINGIKFYLKPGLNQIPELLYNFLIQGKEDAKVQRRKPGYHCLGVVNR